MLNLRKQFAIVLSTVFTIFVVIYPLVVFQSLKNGVPSIALVLLFIILVTRIVQLLRRSTLSAKKRNISFLVAAGLIVCLYYFRNDSQLLLFYPVLLNSFLLLSFLYTVYFPPSMAERFARLREPQLPKEAIDYCTKVTLAWCLFFLFNGLIAFWTICFASLETWTLYNGFLSYLLMVIFAGTEYCLRLRLKKRIRQNENISYT